MSEKGGLAIVIFITSHLALILAAICLSTHNWIEAKPRSDNCTSHGGSIQNSTEFRYSKGLWQYCRENITTVYYKVPEHHKGNHTNGTVVYSKTTFESRHCESFWGDIQPDNMTVSNETSVIFYVTKYAYTDGVVALCLGIILLYVYICMQKWSLCGSLCKAIFCFISFACSGALLLVALVMNGQHYSTDIDFVNLTNYDLYLGWSFYVGIAGTVFTLLSAILGIYMVKLQRLDERPYENVYVNF